MGDKPGLFTLPRFPPEEGDEIRFKLPLGDQVGIMNFFCWKLETFLKALVEGGFSEGSNMKMLANPETIEEQKPTMDYMINMDFIYKIVVHKLK